MPAGFKNPLSLGFQTSLSLLSGDNPLDDAELEEAYLSEALRRGGDEIDLMQLQWKLQMKRSSRQSWRPATGARLLETTDVLSVSPELVRDANKITRDRCIRDHRTAMEEEFYTLGNLQADFGNADGTGSDPVELYSLIRAEMYVAGYDDPAATVFKKIKKGIQMLKKTVGGGLHERFVERLSGLDSQLNSHAPGLADKTGQQLKSVYGFVPRYIKGSRVLSNHAFGLAIDIDPTWNPMVKNSNLIDALKQITGYDFGSPFFPTNVCAVPMDQIQQIYKQQRDASNRLQIWLQRFLPAYEARLSKKPSKKVQLSEEGWDKDACEDIGENEKKLLDKLVGAQGLSDVRAWAKNGIQTIPLEFAVAMAELGFRWGSTYEHSKDVMHFELEFRKTIEPEVKTPRTLAALFNSLTEPAAKPVSAKKKASARKAHQA